MEADATSKSRLAVLLEEIDLIHFSSMTYWQQRFPSHAAKAGYYRRQDRLEELRGKLQHALSFWRIADLQTAQRSDVLSGSRTRFAASLRRSNLNTGRE
jgi:hypothetical protein